MKYNYNIISLFIYFYNILFFNWLYLTKISFNYEVSLIMFHIVSYLEPWVVQIHSFFVIWFLCILKLKRLLKLLKILF